LNILYNIFRKLNVFRCGEENCKLCLNEKLPGYIRVNVVKVSAYNMRTSG